MYSEFSMFPERVPPQGLHRAACVLGGAGHRRPRACPLLVASREAVSPRGDPVSCLCLSDVSSDYGGMRALNNRRVLFNQTGNGEKCIFVNAPIIPIPTRTKNVFCRLPGSCCQDPLIVLSRKYLCAQLAQPQG